METQPYGSYYDPRQTVWVYVERCGRSNILRMVAASHAPGPLLALLPRASLWTFTFDLWFLLDTAGEVAL